MAAPKYSKLAGTHVLIIGGSSGIGYAVAEACVESGAARVTVSSSSAARVASAAASLQASYPTAAAAAAAAVVVAGFACDLGDASTAEANLEALFQSATAAAAAPVDHVVFTAADALSISPLADLAAAQITGAAQMRLVAPVLAAKVAARHLAATSASSFTLTTGSVGARPRPGWAVVGYFAAGLAGLARALALDMAPVRVNAVAPDFVDTALWSKGPGGLDEQGRERMKAALREKMLVEEPGRVEDVAEAYLWLMKDRNVTGTVAATDSGCMLV